MAVFSYLEIPVRKAFFNQIKRAIAFLVCMLFCVPLFGCQNKVAQVQLSQSFGVSYVRAYGLSLGEKAAFLREIEGFLTEFEKRLGTEVEQSDVARINSASVGERVTVSDLTIQLYTLAKELYEKTGGAFDPAIYPCVKLWGFDPKNSAMNESRAEPSKEEIDEALSKAGFSKLQRDGEALYKTAEIEVDFGAISKGFAADQCLAIIQKYAPVGAIINIAGNTHVFGRFPEGKSYRPFRVGITNPRKQSTTGTLFGQLSIRDAAIVTSGDYMRFYENDGKRYCHVISPFTGRPVETGIASVTVIAKEGACADAVATAVMCLGEEKGVALLEEMGLSAVLIFDDLSYRVVGTDYLIEESVSPSFRVR